MKKVSILACVLLFVSVAAFAQTPSYPPLTQEALAAILGQPAASSCAAQPGGVRQAAAKRPVILRGKSLCTATAECHFYNGTVASCSSNTSTSSCTSVDSNCSAGEPGHVTCDGVTTYCPPCCTGGGTQYQCCKCEQTGDCEACCRCNGGTIGHCALQCS
jgi:hypothetical protein